MRHTIIIIFVFAAAAASALRRLEGATVLITTPSPYAARLKSALHAQGAAVVHLEAVRTELLHGGDQRKLRRALLIDHRNGDYVAFTSRRGIQVKTRLKDTREDSANGHRRRLGSGYGQRLTPWLLRPRCVACLWRSAHRDAFSSAPRVNLAT